MTHFFKTLIPAIMLPILLFSCNGKSPKPNIKFTVSPKSFVIGKDAESKYLTISSPATWNLSSDREWVTIGTPSGGSGVSIKIELEVAGNTNKVDRTAILTLKASGESDIKIELIQDGTESAVGVTRWIYDKLKVDYYWNKAVQDATPKYHLAYDKFLSDLLLNLKGAEDKTESPWTIDGYYYEGKRKLYSSIERSDAETRADNYELTFGLDIFGFWADQTNTSINVLITNVLPKGPADKAGLKRGMWITKYNGLIITESQFGKLVNDIYYLESGSMQVGLSDGVTKTITATSSEITPIYLYKVIEDTTVGYLAYNQFERGNEGEYDESLKNDVFKLFKTNKITDLVLDLRYNPGGYVESCRILTSLIADGSSKPIFAKLQYAEGSKLPRGGNPEILKYQAEANSLNLTRLYVLGTDESASASEMVISSLRGIWGDANVILIGETTNGKNVGMDQFETTIGGYKYEMWPITFKIKNAKDFCDYAGGFKPNYLINEFRQRGSKGDNKIYELGDKNEELLKAALTLINGGAVEVDKPTRASDSKALAPTKPMKPGAIMRAEDRQGADQ